MVDSVAGGSSAYLYSISVPRFCLCFKNHRDILFHAQLANIEEVNIVVLFFGFFFFNIKVKMDI